MEPNEAHFELIKKSKIELLNIDKVFFRNNDTIRTINKFEFAL